MEEIERAIARLEQAIAMFYVKGAPYTNIEKARMDLLKAVRARLPKDGSEKKS